MNATFSEVRGNEVYVYVRGRLVMKRWLENGLSVFFYEVGHPVWSTRDWHDHGRHVRYK